MLPIVTSIAVVQESVPRGRTGKADGFPRS
jgi:hypothetical protein